MFPIYPYINVNDLNLDYILRQIQKLTEELTNFVSLNAIKYANPIQWDITKQYEKNTVVIDQNTYTGYISVAPVPQGVNICNTDYWTPIFNLMNFIEKINQSLTSNDEGTNTTASRAYTMGEWIWINNVLYIASMDIAAGSSFILNTNIKTITVEDMTTNYYYPNDKKLTIRGVISDYSEIVTRGDYHVYNANKKAIEILEVE